MVGLWWNQDLLSGPTLRASGPGKFQARSNPKYTVSFTLYRSFSCCIEIANALSCQILSILLGDSAARSVKAQTLFQTKPNFHIPYSRSNSWNVYPILDPVRYNHSPTHGAFSRLPLDDAFWTRIRKWPAFDQRPANHSLPVGSIVSPVPLQTRYLTGQSGGALVRMNHVTQRGLKHGGNSRTMCWEGKCSVIPSLSHLVLDQGNEPFTFLLKEIVGTTA